MTNDNLRKLYDALSQQYNVGEFDAFSQKMNDPANRKKAYDAASQKYNLGSYEEFESKIGLSQPNASATDTVQAAPSPKKDFYNNADTVQQAAPVAQESVKVGGKEIPAIQTDSLPKLDNVQQVVDDAGEQIAAEEAWKQQIKHNIRRQAAQADSLATAAQEESNRVYKENKGVHDQVRQTNWSLGVGGMSGSYPVGTYSKEELQATKNAAEQKIAAKRAQEAVKVVDEADRKGNTNFFAGLGRGFMDKASNSEIWTQGIESGMNNKLILEAANKFENGESLTESEKALLDATALEAVAQQEFGGDLGRGYKAGSMTAESAPFMLEMLLSPATGMGKGISKWGVKKFGVELFASLAKQKAARVGMQMVGDVAGAATMTATSSIGGVIADTERRQTGEADTLVHNEGIEYGGANNQEDYMSALGKSFGSRFVENYSEMFGEYFTPIGRTLGKTAGNTLNKVGLSSVNDAIQKVGASTWARSVDDFMAKTQWNGVVGEWGEEQVGTVLHSIIDGDSQMSDLLDLDQQIDTFLGVATMGGFMSAIKTVGYRRPGRAEEKKLRKADIDAENLLGKDWLDMREAIDNADSQQLKKILKDNAWGHSPEEARAILTYAANLQSYRGTNIAEQKRREEGLVTPEEIQQEDNFRAGLDLAIGQAQQKRQAYLDYKESIENLDDQSQQLWDLSGIRERAERGEDVSQYIDALNKQTIYEGLVQGIADNIDKKVEQESKRIDDINNFGQIVVVTPKEDDQRRLYVVRGWVAQDGDGNVDTHRSDQALMVRDENGKLEMRPASDFMKTWSVYTEETRAVTLDELRRTETEKAAAELETPGEEEKQDAIESIQIGDQLSLNMNGKTVPATVQQAQTANGTTLLLFDNPVMDENGKEVRVMEVTPEQLQTMMQPTPSGELVTPVEQQGQEQLQEGINVSANDGGNAVSPTGEAINVSEQTAEEQTAVDPYAGFPRDKDGEIDADNLTVEQGILYAETEMGRDYAVSFAEKAAKALIAEREKVQKKLEKEINPVRSIKIEKEIAGIDKKIAYYRDYMTVKEAPVAVEAPVKQAADPIKNKWGQAEKFEGGQDEIALANGEKIKGRYVLVDASAPTASHDPSRNFAKSEGFPVNESGSTVNDRDYEKDKLAQNEVLTTANQYDQRALQTPVIVSKEGIVLSGNQRTMSGQLAASQGSDTAYNEYLKQYANKYGFTPDQVATMQHPRVVFVLESDMPYNTETFAKFNADDKKSMNKTEQAVKIGKTIQDKTINKIAIAIDGYDTLGKLYGDERATSEIVGYLVTDGVIGQNEVAELLDGKVFSAKGQEFLENLLMGSVLEENAIRQISSMKDLRQPIIKALSELAANRRFGENGLLKEISQAIALVYEGRRSGTIEKGSNVAPAIMQTDMFEQKEYSRTVQFLANLLNKNQTVFKKALSLYNTKVQLQASGQLDAFATEPLTKDEILDDIEKLIGYKNETIDTRGKGNDSGVGDEGSSSGRTESGTTGTTGESTGTTGTEAVNPVSGDTGAESENPIEQIQTESAPVEGAKTQSAPVETPSPANTPTDIFGAAEAAVQKEKVKKAEKQVDTKPTDGQKKAGNYKMGHVKIGNYDITIENPKGSVREGVDKDGEKWSITMNNTYGYFRGTKGKDGDHIDVFLGDNLQSKKVFVVDQVNPDGSFDEHKVMLGFNTLEEAKAAYLSNYSEDWQGLGNITETSKENFDKWADTDTRKQKPFADYKQNAEETVERGIEEAKDAKEVEVNPEKDVQEEVKPKVKEEVNPNVKDPKLAKAEEEANAALDDFLKSFNEVNTDTFGIIDNSAEKQAKLLVSGTKMVGAFVKLGYYKFADIVKQIQGRGIQLTEELLTAIKKAYVAFVVDSDLEELDDMKTVRSFKLSDLQESTTNVSDSQENNIPLDKEPTKTKEDVPNRTRDGERDRQNDTNEVSGDAASVPGDGGRSGQVGNGISGNSGETVRQRSGKSGSKFQPTLFGEPSDNGVLPKEQINEKPTSGDTDGRGNGIDSPEGHYVGRRAGGAGDKNNTQLPETFKQRTARKIKEQQVAESVPVKLMDESNIRETLPLLLPEQQDDVLKAENRFFGAKHKTKEAAFGKGMLFTNGTGTGKTFTGLGIAKRFEKQGKKNILIVVPSEAKINDWVKDGVKIGLQITPLESTKDKGENAVITTYANFRSNEELKERDFDLVMYDESHRLMEEKSGTASSTTFSHYGHSNVSEAYAFRRLESVNPLFLEIKQLNERIYTERMMMGNLDMMQEEYLERLAKVEKMEEEADRLQARYNKEVEPVLKARARKAYENTKVVFLSATPFKGHFNLRYANGSLFDWGEETITNARGSRVDAESQFFLNNFGSAYEWRYHKLQSKRNSNAEAIAMQEVEFAQKLMEQGAMSGRAIESDMDYSREFPLVALEQAEVFNMALNDIYSGELNRLSQAARFVFNDYVYTTKLFESLKASMNITRIQQHLDLGRKVIIFHRRKQANVLPPFQSILDRTRLDAQIKAHELQNMQDGQKKDELSAEIDLMYEQIKMFENKYAGLLQYEQTLNYDSAIDQISNAFPGKVLTLNGDTPKKDKSKNVELFNDDNSRKDIIIIQEEAGKEGISLHDTTGVHQRVLISLSLPISSTTALQIEGRPYRIGNESNAIFEYPLLGLDQEISDFGQKINKKLSTTENLAIGNQARDLLRSFAEGVLFNSGTGAPQSEQGKGGKEYDKKAQEKLSEFRKAVLVYNTNQKVSGRRDQREGMDYYATPEPLGQKMVEWLGLQEEEAVLEPSAGHGAIAMWFPERASVTAIEPSYKLFAKLNARSGGGNRKIVNDTFENFNIINKFQGVAMNPPFGVGGKTAIDHVAKAFGHLKNRGRIVAIIPQGQADKRLDSFLKENNNAHLIASIKLPNTTFEQAGTSVSTRMVVIDKIIVPTESDAMKIVETQVVKQMQRGQRKALMSAREEVAEAYKLIDRVKNSILPTQELDLTSAPNIDELFNAIEHVEVNPRVPENLYRIEEDKTVTQEDVPLEQFVQYNTRTGDALFMVAATKFMERKNFDKLSSLAKENHGFYSSYTNKMQNIRAGFTFKTKEDSDNFYEAASSFINKEEEVEDIRFRENTGVPDGAQAMRIYNHPLTVELMRWYSKVKKGFLLKDGEIDIEAAKELYDGMKHHGGRLSASLRRMSKERGDVKMDLFSEMADKIDYAINFYEALSKGEDVWHEDLPMFRENQSLEDRLYSPIESIKKKIERYTSPIGFYSTVEDALSKITQEKGTKDQFRAMLLKNGAKQVEMDWMGFDELPDKLTKEDIQNWIDSNRIDVEEVEKGKGEEDDYRDAVYNHVRDELARIGELDVANEETIDRWYNNPTEENKWSMNALLNENNIDIEYIEDSATTDISTTKYSQYVLPGGKNYRELLLTMPIRKILPEGYTLDKVGNLYNVFDKDGNVVSTGSNAEIATENALRSSGIKFQSSHFYEPNILAHIRFDEREINGERVLFIEEFQSDWAQKGKKEGFVSKEKDKDVIKAEKILEQANADLKNAINKRRELGLSVGAGSTEQKMFGSPSWLSAHNVEYNVLNDRLDGVRNNKDYDEINQRINEILSEYDKARADYNQALRDVESGEKLLDSMKRLDEKHRMNNVPDMPFKKTDQWVNLAMRRMMRYAAENGFDRIAWTNGEQQAERYDLSKTISSINAEKTNKGDYKLEISINGKGIQTEYVTTEKMPDIIGKELSDKIIKNNGGFYSGLDLKVGGEGMKAFYDNIVPKAAKKLVKPFGAKLDDMQLEDKSTVQSVPVTESMRASVMGGVPIFRGEPSALFQSTTFYKKEQIKKAAESLAKELNTAIRFVTREQMPKGHSTAKGYYLNGEVVICAENHDDVADVQSTILHEIVAHKGLREMFGDNFKSFLREVYGNASKEVRAAINNLSRKYGYDVSIATEEYMASIAENGVGLSVWNKIQNYFRNMLSKLGLDLKITDNDIKYILWRSYQHQTGESSIYTAAKASSMRFRLFDSNAERNNIIREAKAAGTYLKAPNGEATNLTPEQWVTVRTKAFKNWFGDWEKNPEKASKIVDKNGEPLVVYHGTNNKFNTFKPHFAEGLGFGIYTTDSRKSAEEYGSIIKELFCDMKKPYRYEEFEIKKTKAYKEYRKKLIEKYDYEEEDNAANPSFYDISESESEVLNKAIQELGYDGISILESNSITGWYENLSFSPDKLKSATDNNGEFDPDNNDIRFRLREDAPADYEERMQEASFKWRESYQDSMLALKEYQNQIERKDGEVKDIENAYIAENSMSSRSHYETEFFLMNQFRAMEDAIKKLLKSRTYEDIKAYAVAKHGLERNRVFAWRDALNTIEDQEAKEQIEKEYNDQLYLLKKSLEKGAIKRDKFDQMLEEFRNTATPAYALFRGQDYSGLTDLTGEKDFEAAAQMMVDEFEKGVESETSELWKSVNDATKATLKKTFDSGLMTRSTYDKVRNMFEFYVPLRGWDEKVAHDVYEYITSDKTSFNAPLKVAKGRKSMADDPFATIGNMAESGILQGNRNLMKQRFLNLALNHPNKLLSVKGMWYENIGTEKDPEWVRSIPDIPNDATPEEVNDIVEQHDEHMKELQDQGLARQDGSRLHLKYRASAREKSEHAVIVKMGGKEYVIFVNGNPRLAQAVNGLTNPDATEDKDVKFIKRVNRMLSKNFTTRNPSFILSNMSRDLLFSSTAVAIKENGSYAKTFMKNATANVGLIWSLMQKYKANKLDMNNERERLFSEFIQNGGETGYTALNNVDEYKKIMQRDLKKIKGQIGSISHAGTSIVEAIGFMNRCAEDVSRFSAYMTSRQDGRTIERSIYDAKEISVNFNKKGAGGRGSTRLKNLYLFFNAAVQGLNNLNELRKKNAGKFYTAVGGFAAAGIFVPILNEVLLSLIGDDDDKDAYNNLPDWVRRNNFVIWAGGDKFITIPLPIELRALYGLGEIFYQLGSGNMKGKKKMDIAIDMANQITELLPLNPLGNGGNVPTGITDAMAAFSPDALKPVLQVAANKDFFGLPIYKDFDYNKNMPAYTKAYSGTNKELIKSAELLNAITGGDKYKSGSINANPSVIEHLVESYLGGMGKTVNQTVKTIQAVFSQDEEVLSRNVPVLNRFLSSTDDKTAFRRVNEMYFNYLDEYKATEQQLRGYKKEMEKGDEGFAKKLDSLYNTKAYDRYELIHSYKKILDDYKTFIDESEGEERDSLKKEQDIIKAELVDQLMQIK